VAPEAVARLPWHRQLLPRLAAGVARLLVLLPPLHLRQLLRLASLGARPADAGQARQAPPAVLSGSLRCAGPGGRRPRSAATPLLCRWRGTWPDWCTGFRIQPFAAHAWVEAAGSPVGEPADMAPFHTVISVRRPGGRDS